jgi:hypothetical protein
MGRESGEWRNWPSWMINEWWEERVRGRKRSRYGYE